MRLEDLADQSFVSGTAAVGFSRDFRRPRPYPARVPSPSGFEYAVRGGEVLITHHRTRAAVLRGPAARQFLDDVEREDPQLLMARLTGDYRRGNERTARQHPRNRGR